VNMEPSIPASDSNKSEEMQQYFYDEIKTKLSTIENYKKRARYSFIVALLFLALLVLILTLHPFTYPALFDDVLLWIVLLSFLVGAYFAQKVESGRSAPSENGYIFYRLKNIRRDISMSDSKKAEKELRSLIFYVNDIKKSYPDEPFTDKIFKNLSKFEGTLRTNVYPSLKHSNDKIAKNTEIYLNNVLKLVMEGNLDAICDIDIAGLDSKEINLKELSVPTRVEKIYRNIKELYSIPLVKYAGSFSIVTLILLLLDFFIVNESNWEFVKGDLMIVLLIATGIVGGFEVFRKTERHA